MHDPNSPVITMDDLTLDEYAEFLTRTQSWLEPDADKEVLYQRNKNIMIDILMKRGEKRFQQRNI